MADGHLNKCKVCTKEDTRVRSEEKSKDPVWVEQEAERCRIKMRKARAAGTEINRTQEQVRARNENYVLKYPERKRAHNAVEKALKDGRLKRGRCEKCGDRSTEAHHEDYSQPLKVNWLCKTHHDARGLEIKRKKRLAQLLP